MKLVRYLLVVLVAIVVIVVGAVAAVLVLIDPNAYRAEIGAQVEAATGRPLSIDGDIELDPLSLTPSVVMNDVGFANASWGTRPEMIRFDRIELAFELQPLLSGDIRVRRLVLVRPDILLETDQRGVGNWIFEDPDPGAVKPDADRPHEAPLVSEIVVEDAAITYRDGRTGEVISGTLGSHRLYGAGAAQPLTLEASGTLNGEPVEIDAELDPLADLLHGETYGARLDLALGESDVEGRVEVELRAAPPRLTGELASERLNLDRLTGEGESSEDSDDGLFDDAPLRFELLKIVDGEFGYRTGELILAGESFTDVSGKVTLAEGELRVRDLSGTVAGGELTGSLVADSRQDPASVSIDATLEGAELGRFTGGSATGAVDASAAGTGAGRSLAEIMGTMTGRVAANMDGGKIDDDVLGLLSADLLSAIQPWAPPDKGVVLNCAVADFAIADGVAHQRVLLVDTNRAYILGRQGDTVNLRTERVDMLLDPFTKRTSVATLMATPLRVSGPLADPSIDPDPGAALRNVAGLPFDVVGTVLGEAIGVVEGIITGGARSGDANYCAAARQAAVKGTVWPKGGRPSGEASGVGEAIEEGIKGIGEGIESIFE